MTYRVTKPFKTRLRRFAEGAAVDAAEIDGPLAAEDWAALGHLAAQSADAPREEPAAPSDPADQPDHPGDPA